MTLYLFIAAVFTGSICVWMIIERLRGRCYEAHYGAWTAGLATVVLMVATASSAVPWPAGQPGGLVLTRDESDMVYYCRNSNCDMVALIRQFTDNRKEAAADVKDVPRTQ